MARAKGMIVRDIWIKPLLELKKDDLAEIFRSMLEFYFNGTEPIQKEEATWQLIFSQLRQSHINSNNGANGGNPELKPKGITIKPKTDPTLFDRFWAGYPKKVGKAYAKKCFDRLRVSEVLLEKMLLSIEEQKKSEQWRARNGAFIPNPSTWLNQGRWDDEVTHTEKSIYDNLRLGETW